MALVHDSHKRMCVFISNFIMMQLKLRTAYKHRDKRMYDILSLKFFFSLSYVACSCLPQVTGHCFKLSVEVLSYIWFVLCPKESWGRFRFCTRNEAIEYTHLADTSVAEPWAPIVRESRTVSHRYFPKDTSILYARPRSVVVIGFFLEKDLSGVCVVMYRTCKRVHITQEAIDEEEHKYDLVFPIGSL